MVSTAAADADDTAILSVLHEREYRSSHLNGAVNVALNHVIDVFFRKFHEVLGDFVGNADVVDQQADASIRVHLLQRLLQRIVEARSFFSCLRAIVSKVTNRVGVFGLQDGGLLLQLVFAARNDQDGHADLRQVVGELLANTRSGSCSSLRTQYR